ncbi:MAG: hypothetical protein IH921_00170 [Gemmatimonadetes bacterium]|nr:hypothetical protein [Gemmatimonadota bacterium]
MRYPVKSRSIQELKRLTTPQAVAAGQSEAVPYVLFDTQLFTSAVSTELNYFQAVQGDKTLGNMQAGGQLVADRYLEIWGINIDPLIDDTSTGLGRIGAWADMNDLMWTNRPTFTFTMDDKKIGPFPCSYFHASGGITGFGYGQGTGDTTIGIAPSAEEYANWGIFDGGFWVGGSMIIPPQSGFVVDLRWPAAVTLQGGNPNIRVGLVGVLHRNVL